MLKDSHPSRYAVRRTHRTYSAQFKAELVAASHQPGASIAALALQHGMNANVLHRWRKEWAQGLHRLTDHVPAATLATQPPAFIPIDLNPSPSMPGSAPPPQEPCTAASDIRIELQRAGSAITVHWPLSAAAACAQLLQSLLP